MLQGKVVSELLMLVTFCGMILGVYRLFQKHTKFYWWMLVDVQVREDVHW
jgi:hypothetical protein